MCGGTLGKALGTGGGGGSSPLKKVVEEIGMPATVDTQIGAGAGTTGQVVQRRKPRSLLSMSGMGGGDGGASVVGPALKATLGA
jgi:hypothetical protein